MDVCSLVCTGNTETNQNLPLASGWALNQRPMYGLVLDVLEHDRCPNALGHFNEGKKGILSVKTLVSG